MTPEELVGMRIREAREATGMTQRELGERIEAYLGTAWLPQAVSAAEQGGRKFDPSELVALALVLDRPIPYFFLPEGPGDVIDMPGGELSGLHLLHLLSIREGARARLTKVQGRLEALKSEAEDLARELEGLKENVEDKPKRARR